MYNLPYFKDKDESSIKEFILAHPFAFIAGCNDKGQPVATQIPVFLEEREGVYFLTGHMMKSTDHHKAFEINDSVLCVFSSPSTYVSATWYSNPHQASTWNYMSVHAKGKIRFMDDVALVEILKKTSLHFENGNERSTTVFDNLPPDYREPLMKAIVAFEVEVESIDHVFKLSQNRDKESYHAIMDKLSTQHADAQFIAEEMKKRVTDLYPE